jgi:hypothetical protein
METRQDQGTAREPAGLAIAFVIGAAAISVGIRLIPRLSSFSPVAPFLWNFMPVGALGLFAGARLRSRWAFLVPVLVMMVADIILMKPLAAAGQPTFDEGTPVVYLSMAIYSFIGRGMVGREISPLRIGAGSILGSVQFFVLTNFISFYATGNTYPRTFMGLIECFAAGVPFCRGTFVGDLLYSGYFFGTYAVLLHLVQREKASEPA